MVTSRGTEKRMIQSSSSLSASSLSASWRVAVVIRRSVVVLLVLFGAVEGQVALTALRSNVNSYFVASHIPSVEPSVHTKGRIMEYDDDDDGWMLWGRMRSAAREREATKSVSGQGIPAGARIALFSII